MREAAPRPERAETIALAVAILWMLLVQFACVLLWDAGWLSRQASLVHWLLVGVLPPALSLWRVDQAAALR
jgi:hypothetical protein